MSRCIKWTLLLGYALVLFSCAKVMTETEKTRLPRKKTSDMLQMMDSLSRQKPTFFYSKIATNYTDTNRSVSFKTSVRMVKDSAISALITYVSLPVFNAMITTDSVKIVNKKDKCYSLESLAFIKDNFGIDFNYANLEELILGLPIVYDTTQKYFQIHDPFKYTLSTHKKRAIRRFDRNGKLVEREEFIIKYFVNNELNHLSGFQVDSPSDSTLIVVDYLEREFVNGYSIPKEVFLQIKTPRNSMRVVLRYDKIELNERQELFFVIPEKYEKCN